jgi:hypothetical protein
VNAIRQAAFRLHELSNEERAWMLDQLSPDEQSRIGPALAKLDAIMGQDDEDDGKLAEAENSSPVESAPPLDWRSVVASADGRSLAVVLADQPNVVIAAFLIAEEWAWRGRFLKSLPRARRRKVKHSIEKGARHRLGPATQDALVEVVGRWFLEGRPEMENGMGFESVLAREQRAREGGGGESLWQR